MLTHPKLWHMCVDSIQIIVGCFVFYDVGKHLLVVSCVILSYMFFHNYFTHQHVSWTMKTKVMVGWIPLPWRHIMVTIIYMETSTSNIQNTWSQYPKGKFFRMIESYWITSEWHSFNTLSLATKTLKKNIRKISYAILWPFNFPPHRFAAWFCYDFGLRTRTVLQFQEICHWNFENYICSNPFSWHRRGVRLSTCPFKPPFEKQFLGWIFKTQQIPKE